MTNQYKSKHEKFIKSLECITLENFIERISALEYNLQIPDTEEQISYVPLEANFQIPNIFLKTKKENMIERLFNENTLNVQWDDQIDRAVEFLDECEFEINEETPEPECDEKIMEKLIRMKFGNSDI